ncbi:hypothetical protein [Chryseobacterium sp.]|uniref:hypothetical protein n=1 Tax=Chryseobacterium sp. TaxID=1871047 RepID=UPI00289B50AF|nr:hypothetical protein [Chryseobacterium sp.]
MKKILVLSVLSLFIVYTILSLFIKISEVFSNIFYAMVTIFAGYFIVFQSDIGRGIKEKFQENNNKVKSKGYKK